MIKCVSFTKTHLLIIVSRIIIDDWNAINKGMLLKKNNKCCISIIKETNNLRQIEYCFLVTTNMYCYLLRIVKGIYFY